MSRASEGFNAEIFAGPIELWFADKPYEKGKPLGFVSQVQDASLVVGFEYLKSLKLRSRRRMDFSVVRSGGGWSRRRP